MEYNILDTLTSNYTHYWCKCHSFAGMINDEREIVKFIDVNLNWIEIWRDGGIYLMTYWNSEMYYLNCCHTIFIRHTKKRTQRFYILLSIFKLQHSQIDKSYMMHFTSQPDIWRFSVALRNNRLSDTEPAQLCWCSWVRTLFKVTTESI